MTVKRFQWVFIRQDDFVELDDNGIVKILSHERLEELLNELNDENEKLKYGLGAYMVDLNNYKGKYSKLEEENEQLKNMCENLVNSDSRREYKLKQKIKELEEENEQLKTQLSHLEYRFTEYRNKR